MEGTKRTLDVLHRRYRVIHQPISGMMTCGTDRQTDEQIDIRPMLYAYTAIDAAGVISYSNTTVYYEIHESSECISVDCGVTNLVHDRRSCVDFTLEVRRMWLDVSIQA